MRLITAVFTIGVGVAAAQATVTATGAGSSSTDTGCQAENIVQACLATTKVRVDNCSQQDYSCLCSAYQDQLTCYNNCPNDAGRATIQSEVTAWCNAASGQAALSAASSTGSVSATAGSASAPVTTSMSETNSATAAAATTSSSALANAVALPAGSLFAIALGLLGML